jgi:hypothetical protein
MQFLSKYGPSRAVHFLYCKYNFCVDYNSHRNHFIIHDALPVEMDFQHLFPHKRYFQNGMAQLQ